MYIPALRERVVVRGRSHYYFVVAADFEEQVAFVVDLRDHGYVERVAFGDLTRYPYPMTMMPAARNAVPPVQKKLKNLDRAVGM